MWLLSDSIEKWKEISVKEAAHGTSLSVEQNESRLELTSHPKQAQTCQYLSDQIKTEQST